MLQLEWLRDIFLHLNDQHQIEWKLGAIWECHKQVDRLTEQRLLLLHLTGGQLARGTELVSLLLDLPYGAVRGLTVPTIRRTNPDQMFQDARDTETQ